MPSGGCLSFGWPKAAAVVVLLQAKSTCLMWRERRRNPCFTGVVLPFEARRGVCEYLANELVFHLSLFETRRGVLCVFGQ